MNDNSHKNALQQNWADAFESLKDKLSTTIEIAPLLRIYAYELGELFSLCGVFYFSCNPELIVKIGEQGYHTEEFYLRQEEKLLGTLVFSKNTPFTAAQLSAISSSLSILGYPLKHALAYHEALRLSLTDPLTGVGNRAALNAVLERAVSHAKLTGNPLCLLTIDIDHFKKINDTHGHPTGDAVLCQLAAHLSHLFRQSDTVFRYGGEEFVILVHGNLQAAKIVAERARLAIASLYETSTTPSLQVTISSGLTSFRLEDTAATFFARSDEALLSAKQSGRNCVCIKE